MTAMALTKNSYAYHSVRQRILDGELAPGSQISQPQLAGELGISITPLREAMKQLDTEGLVRLDTFRTVVVAPLDPQELQDLLSVRAALDPLAAELAAVQADAREKAQLSDAAAQLSVPAAAGRFAARRNYFSLLYRISGNKLLVELLEPVWDKTYRYYQQSLLASQLGAAALEQADVLLEAATRAIDAADAAAAQRAMTQYIESCQEPWFHAVAR